MKIRNTIFRKNTQYPYSVFNITKKKQIQTWHFTFEILRTFLNVQYVNTIFKYRSSVRCWNRILIWSLILFSKHKYDVHIYWYWCCLNISAVLTDTDTKIKCLKTKIYRLQLVLKDTISRDNQPNLKDLHWSNPNTNLWSLIRNPEYQISISWSGEGGRCLSEMERWWRRLTVGLIGAILAVPVAIASLRFRITPATGTLVLWTWQWLQGTAHLITAIRAIHVTIASNRAIIAWLIAEELIRTAVAGF